MVKFIRYLADQMSKINNRIPINSMSDNPGQGISIDKMTIKRSDFTTEVQYQEAKRSHRDQGHTFHIVEQGTVVIEIDFQIYHVTAPAVVYMHPDQVHRILEFGDLTVCSIAIKDEALNPEYLDCLKDIVPAKPLTLTEESNTTVSAIFSLCLNFSTQKNNKLYYALLKDSCNTLVAFLTSQFLYQTKTVTHPSRFEIVSKSFKKLLEKDYRTSKRPGEYAQRLNISTAYLNECIKHTTGFSVSHFIHDRVILEAKRLLYHTNKSVKEIAFELGYEDYPYFSKLFTKVAGMSAITFRNKNHD